MNLHCATSRPDPAHRPEALRCECETNSQQNVSACIGRCERMLRAHTVICLCARMLRIHTPAARLSVFMHQVALGVVVRQGRVEVCA